MGRGNLYPVPVLILMISRFPLCAGIDSMIKTISKSI
jgi:hypothetical protein